MDLLLSAAFAMGLEIESILAKLDSISSGRSKEMILSVQDLLVD